MRRVLVAIAGGVLFTSLAAAPVMAAPQQSPKSVSYNDKLRCDEDSPLCAEPVDSIGENGTYTGHDEPSTVFYSNKTGAGNNAQYQLVVPKDVAVFRGDSPTWYEAQPRQGVHRYLRGTGRRIPAGNECLGLSLPSSQQRCRTASLI